MPVKAYPAVVAQNDASLHQIHQGCGLRIQYRKHCPTHGEVAADAIVKAYELAPTDHLVVTAEELAALRPEEKFLRIQHLLPESKMDFSLLSGRSLHLVAAHPPAESLYQSVVRTIGSENWAIGDGVLSEQRQPIAIHVVEGRLLLHVLHWPRQRRASPLVRQPASTQPIAALSLDGALVELRRPFVWDQYRDEFEERLTVLVQEKVIARSQAGLSTSLTGRQRAKRAAVGVKSPLRRARAA